MRSRQSLIGLGFVLRPRRLLAIHLDGAVAGEVVLLLEQFLDLGHAVLDALLVDIENREGRVGIAEQHVVVQRVAVFRGEKIDILLREVEVIVVEPFEVVLEEALRDLLVELHPAVMPLLEQPPDGNLDLARIGLIGPEAGGTERHGQSQRRAKSEEIFHRTDMFLGNG